MKKGIIVIAVIFSLLILVVGVPLTINECYKAGGYVTMWNAEDVLFYCGFGCHDLIYAKADTP